MPLAGRTEEQDIVRFAGSVWLVGARTRRGVRGGVVERYSCRVSAGAQTHETQNHSWTKAQYNDKAVKWKKF